jgi:hypothetical protein
MSKILTQYRYKICYVSSRSLRIASDLDLDSLKGTGSPDGLRYFLNVWIDVGGISKRREWFFNF